MKLKALKLFAVAGVMFMYSCGGETKTEDKKTDDSKNNTEESADAGHDAAADDHASDAAPAADTQKGADLFKGSGCVACHQLDNKVVGPSLVEIAAAYDGNKDGMIAFLKEEGDAIVDPSQYAVMQANLAITKGMSDEDLGALADYLLSPQ